MNRQGVIENIKQLEGLVETTAPALMAEVTSCNKSGVNVIVTETYDIYHSPIPKDDLPAQVAFDALKRRVRQAGPGSKYTISTGVYDSWVQKKTVKTTNDTNRESVQKVDELLDSAISAGASDVHIEIRDETIIKYRVHGMLTHAQTLSGQVGRSVVASLFQHYAATGFGEKEEARDGKFYHTHKMADKYLVRLNKLSMVDNGMTCKIRFRQTNERADINAAGYSPGQLDLFRKMMESGSGLLIITGAVNSGKSTTMTALLHSVPPEFSVLEISDTVEVRLPNVCHVELPADGDQIEKRVNAIQDAVVRQDSDYLAIGEIRNRITAAQAEVMGLQGKFVISTGHAADAVSFYQRMISPDDFGMSVNTVLAPDFVRGIVSQSLIEMLCAQCSQEMPSLEAAARSPKKTPQDVAAYYKGGLGPGIRYHNPKGCDQCNHTGLSGRTVVAECLPFDEGIRRLLREGKYDQIKDWMAENNIETKHQHALPRVMQGKIDPLHLARRVDALSPETVLAWGKVRKQAQPARGQSAQQQPVSQQQSGQPKPTPQMPARPRQVPRQNRELQPLPKVVG